MDIQIRKIALRTINTVYMRNPHSIYPIYLFAYSTETKDLPVCSVKPITNEEKRIARCGLVNGTDPFTKPWPSFTNVQEILVGQADA